MEGDRHGSTTRLVLLRSPTHRSITSRTPQRHSDRRVIGHPSEARPPPRRSAANALSRPRQRDDRGQRHAGHDQQSNGQDHAANVRRWDRPAPHRKCGWPDVDPHPGIVLIAPWSWDRSDIRLDRASMVAALGHGEARRGTGSFDGLRNRSRPAGCSSGGALGPRVTHRSDCSGDVPWSLGPTGISPHTLVGGTDLPASRQGRQRAPRLERGVGQPGCFPPKCVRALELRSPPIPYRAGFSWSVGQAWSRPARSKERRGADLGAYTDPPAAEAFGRLPRRPPVLHTDGWRHQSMSMSADLGKDRQASSVSPGRSRHPRGISRRL